MRLGRTCEVVVQGRRDVKYGTAGKTEGSTASNIVAHHFPKKIATWHLQGGEKPRGKVRNLPTKQHKVRNKRK